MSETNQFKKLALVSSFSELQRIEPYLNELREWGKLSTHDFERLLLALSEAVTNAIVHGNKQDPRKKVLISTSIVENRLFISVTDEGEGFDLDSLPDPLKDENLLNEGGRGVYLIEHYADEVNYSNNGTKLTMIFDLEK